jgi:Arc/MetJ-type ribon-helix-helix transcriptional regulator
MKERFTISVEPEALQIARAEVEAGKAPSVSAAVEGALRARGKSQALREAVQLWEAEHGAISEEAREWARRELSRAFEETSSSTPER